MSTDLHPVLPPELQEQIVDSILSFPDHQERKTTLQTCLFVCRTFRIQARCHLFSSVTILNRKKGATMNRLALLRHLVEFEDTFARSVASSIQHFTVLNVDGDERSKTFLDNGDLVAIMAKLHDTNRGIQSFTVVVDMIHRISWYELSPDFQRAFRSLCRSSFLKSLEITNLQLLPDTLFNGTYLERLLLRDICAPSDRGWKRYYKAPAKDPDLRVVESPPRLTSFITDHTFLFPQAWVMNEDTRDLSTPFSPFTQLKYLCAILTPELFELVYSVTLDILKSSFRYLEALSFRFEGNYREIASTNDTSSDIHFGHLEKLSSLKLSYCSGKFVTRFSITDIGLKPIIYVLQQPGTPPNLDTLDIDIYLALRNPTGKLIDPPESECEAFDSVVSNFCFTSVSKIVMVLRFDLLLSAPESGAKLSARDTDPKRYNSIIRKQVMTSLPKLSDDSRFKLIVNTRIRVVAPNSRPLQPFLNQV